MISYKPLWLTLVKQDRKKTDLVSSGVLTSATLAKMGKGNGEVVSLSVIDRICLFLDCPIQDVVEIVPNKEIS